MREPASRSREIRHYKMSNGKSNSGVRQNYFYCNIHRLKGIGIYLGTIGMLCATFLNLKSPKSLASAQYLIWIIQSAILSETISENNIQKNIYILRMWQNMRKIKEFEELKPLHNKINQNILRNKRKRNVDFV